MHPSIPLSIIYMIIPLLIIAIITLPSHASTLRNFGSVAGTPLTLSWEINDDSIHIQLYSSKLMFIPLLLGPRMTHTDMWICSKHDEWEVGDYWSQGHKMPVPDKKMEGSEDLTNIQIDVSNNQLICGFRRKLITNDPYDIQLQVNQTITVCSQESDTLHLSKHKRMEDVFCFNWTLTEGVQGFSFEPKRLKSKFNMNLLHGVVLTVAWGLLIDVGIVMVRYLRTLKYYKLSHIVIFVVVNLSSIPMILIVLLQKEKSLFVTFPKMTLVKQIHVVLGFTTLILLVVEHVLGMIVQCLQQNSLTQARKFRSIRVVHRGVGYLLYVITKIEVVNGWWRYCSSKMVVVICTGIWLVVWGWTLRYIENLYKSGRLMAFLNYFQKKVKVDESFLSSEREIMFSQQSMKLVSKDDLVADILKGYSRSHLIKQYPHRTFYFFKNMICELKSFSHPGSNSLTSETVGKDVTKYVYGMTPLEGNGAVLFRHSQYTVSFLLENCIGSHCQNLCRLDDSTKWCTKLVTEISRDVFRITFINDKFSIPVFQENPELYLGRYWLISTENATRAYTLLLCESDENVQFRNSLLNYVDSNFTSQLDPITNTQTNQITCIIKKYSLGIVSNEIHNPKPIRSIEGLNGVGLDIRQGLNIIITGGTGILPFLDLFDLLFKKAVYLSAKKSPYCSQSIDQLKNYQNIYNGYKFVVFSSFRQIEEFSYHSPWLERLHKLSFEHSLDLFQMHLRSDSHPTFNAYQGRVDSHFISQLWDQKVAKIFCCGPPDMNDSIFKILKSLDSSEDIFTVL